MYRFNPLTLKDTKLDNQQAIITGVSGFLGQRLCAKILGAGYSVIGIDIKKSEYPDFNALLNNRKFNFIQGPFNDKSESLSSLINSAQSIVFYHLAGLSHSGTCTDNPLDAVKQNVWLTAQTLDFCIKNNISKYIFPSTYLVYGNHCNNEISESDATNPFNIYAFTKLAAEQIIKGYTNTYGLKTIITRMSNIYGPHTKSNTVIGRIVEQIKQNKSTIHIHCKNPIRDFIHIDDVIEGLLRLQKIDCSNSLVVNLSTGQGIAISDLIKKCSESINKPLKFITEVATEKDPVQKMVLKNTRLKELTGWIPQIALNQGLQSLL